MKRRSILASAAILATLTLASVAWANTRLRVPDDIDVPFYLGGGGPFVVEGEPWAMHDGEWAAIPFNRTPDQLPLDFDLLNDFDPNWADSERQIKGFVDFTDDFRPFRWQTRGLGAVPILFVKWSELQDAMADGRLYVGELAAMESARFGTATSYLEENHIYGVHPVSHLMVRARGTLAGGGSFDLHVVEVGLELKEVTIRFND